jgi:hypothetical protein
MSTTASMASSIGRNQEPRGTAREYLFQLFWTLSTFSSTIDDHFTCSVDYFAMRLLFLSILIPGSYIIQWPLWTMNYP